MFSDNQINRYSRHLILNGFGPKAQQKLFNSRVLVIGAGGLGSPALLYLTSAGVGTIGIADFDKVDISNLQRQVLFCENDIGSLKTESSFKRLKSLNSDVDFRLHTEKITPDNILQIIREYDFIIDGSDSIQMKLLINDACIIQEKPFSHAGALEFRGQLMTILPHQSACLRCIFENSLHSDYLTCSQAGILGPVVGTLGTLQALEAIKYLTNTGRLLTNRILSFQGDTMHINTINIKRNLECIVCGQVPILTSLNREEYKSCQ